MIIKNVKIKNYRNFKDFRVDLKPFTLIIGENNIGKTNFLNALGLVLSQEITFFKKRSLELEDINYQAIREFKEDIVEGRPIEEIRTVEVRVELTLSGFSPSQEAVVGDWFIDETFNEAKLTYVYFLHEDLTKWLYSQNELLNKIQKGKGESPEQYRERKIAIVDFPISKYSYRIFGGIDESKSIDNYFFKMLKYEYLDALRDAKRQLVASGEYRLLYKVLSNRGEGKYNEIKEILSGLDAAVKNNSELKTVKKEIREYLEKTSLVEFEADNSVDFEFSKIEETEILKKLSLVYGGSPVTVGRNGLGRNNLLYISLILSHLIGRVSLSTCFRLVAVEEPEAHLHPHLQEHLAKNIETEVDENLQIIITSHSTHITSKLSLENTVILFQKNGEVSSHYVLGEFEDDKGKIKASEKKSINYLKKYLDATKSTMFFAKRIILVEGIAEQILIPKFFERHTGKTLEKCGVSLVNVNGVSFRHFLKVISNGYFVKALVITDRDSDTQRNERASDLKAEYEGQSSELFKIVISSQSTFEKDIVNSNSNGEGKNILLNAIQKTRTQKGKAYKESLGENVINIDDFFGMIEERDATGNKTGDYKSDFSFNLHYCLEQLESGEIDDDENTESEEDSAAHVPIDEKPADNSNEDELDKFKIPDYIIEGFKFIYPTK